MKSKALFTALFISVAMVISSCTTVNLTSWKDPASTATVNHVVILTLFERLDYTRTFEDQLASYFTSKGLTCTKSLDFMPPNQNFSDEELKQKISGFNADAVLVFSPRGADKSVNYTPPTYNGYYRGYWGGMYSVSPGYYTESTTYRIQSNLYTIADEKLIWTGDISTTDPGSIEAAAYEVARKIYDDWAGNRIVKPAAKSK